jgi:cellulose biosynthesis protein BcsQ
MVSVCFFNNKGGVGKTTLTCNIAAHFALRYKKRVLVIDCDPQCNATQLILDESVTSKLYRRKEASAKTGTVIDILRPLQLGDASIDNEASPIKKTTNRFGVDILPGHPRLSMLEDVLSQAWSEGSSGKIGGIRRSNWCSALSAHLNSDYDLAFFDIGPSLGSLNRSVLLGVQHFVSPVGADLFSIFGIRNISDWLGQWLRAYRTGLNLAEDAIPGTASEFGIPLEPPIKKGFAGYTVQQYITKSKGGVRRPTLAYERLLKLIPEEIDEALSPYFSAGVSSQNVHLGDVPHMYSLVPLAQAANTPIQSLTASDGLAGSQFKQSEKYANDIDVIVRVLAGNIGVSLGK